MEQKTNDTPKNILPGWLYDTLKWLCIIVAPAAVTLLTVLTDAWHWDIPIDAICKTITAVAAFIGVILGFSAIQYKKSNADAQTITSVINTLKSVVNSMQDQPAVAATSEGVETSTETVDESVEVIPAPDDEEGKG